MDFARDLGAALAQPLQVNAYLTPPGNQGFATHYDTHDVFVLQVDGRKRWRIHPPVLPDPLERQPWGGRADEVAAPPTGRPRWTWSSNPATRSTCRVAGCTAPRRRSPARCT